MTTNKPKAKRTVTSRRVKPVPKVEEEAIIKREYDQPPIEITIHDPEELAYKVAFAVIGAVFDFCTGRRG